MDHGNGAQPGGARAEARIQKLMRVRHRVAVEAAIETGLRRALNHIDELLVATNVTRAVEAAVVDAVMDEFDERFYFPPAIGDRFRFFVSRLRVAAMSLWRSHFAFGVPAVRLAAGDVIPWPYGLAYMRRNHDEAVYMLVPLNLVVGVARWLYWRVKRLSVPDASIEAEVQRRVDIERSRIVREHVEDAAR